MGMSDFLPAVWEVWHARFDYDDGRGYKYRPVIVVASQEGSALIMMVTSAQNKLHLEHDYLIEEWDLAGLDKPSIARVDRIATIPYAYLGSAGRLGRLSVVDSAALAELLRQAYRPDR